MHALLQKQAIGVCDSRNLTCMTGLDFLMLDWSGVRMVSGV